MLKLVNKVFNKELLFEQALGQAGDSILITDADLKSPGPHILYVNAAFTEMTGFSEVEVLGQTPRILQGPQTDRAVLDQLKIRLAAGHRFHGHTVNYRKDGSPFEVEWHVSPILDGQGRVVRFLAVQRDVSQRKRFDQEIGSYVVRLATEKTALEARQRELTSAQERLQELAATDGLTGLRNHRYFQEMLAHVVKDVHIVSLLFLDLDTFKPYNDTFGHSAGDALLNTVGETLMSFAREGYTVARYGGDEFAMLMPGCDSAEAIATAERVRDSVALLVTKAQSVTVSIGVSTMQLAPGMNASLLEQSDQALYAAKKLGRNRVVHYSELSLRGNENCMV